MRNNKNKFCSLRVKNIFSLWYSREWKSFTADKKFYPMSNNGGEKKNYHQCKRVVANNSSSILIFDRVCLSSDRKKLQQCLSYVPNKTFLSPKEKFFGTPLVLLCIINFRKLKFIFFADGKNTHFRKNIFVQHTRNLFFSILFFTGKSFKFRNFLAIKLQFLFFKFAAANIFSLSEWKKYSLKPSCFFEFGVTHNFFSRKMFRLTVETFYRKKLFVPSLASIKI